MNLKNYTSKIPATQTIATIEALLIAAGAGAIGKEIRDGTITAVIFQLDCGGKIHSIRLPANVEAVQDFLWNEHVTGSTRNRRSREDFKEQAERCAWKIMYDWCFVQLSLIKLKQADVMQVFLAYIWDGKQTYYEYLKGSQFKALPAPGAGVQPASGSTHLTSKIVQYPAPR